MPLVRKRDYFFYMVQEVRGKCLTLGISQLPLQVYFPHSPTLHALWLLVGFGQRETPNKELHGLEEKRSKAFFHWLPMQRHLRGTDGPCLSSEGHSPSAQLPPQVPGTAANPIPSDLEMAMAPCRWLSVLYYRV